MGSGVPAEGLDFDGALRGATCGWVGRGRRGDRPFLTGVFEQKREPREGGTHSPGKDD